MKGVGRLLCTLLHHDECRVVRRQAPRREAPTEQPEVRVRVDVSHLLESSAGLVVPRSKPRNGGAKPRGCVPPPPSLSLSLSLSRTHTHTHAHTHVPPAAHGHCEAQDRATQGNAVKSKSDSAGRASNSLVFFHGPGTRRQRSGTRCRAASRRPTRR